MQYIGLIILFIIILVLKELVEQKAKESTPKENSNYYPYEKKMLLTKTEYAFYKILKKKCDEHNLLICPKVRMEDFLTVTDKKNVMKYRGYIKSRHIDFMLCNKDLHIIAGVELDDNSHKKEKAQAADHFKNQVFCKINIPLFRIKTSGKYEEQLDTVLNTLFPNETIN